VDRRLIGALGLFGATLVIGALWLVIADWRAERSAAVAVREAEAALEQILVPVQNLKRVLASEQVQNLAVRALRQPETLADLQAYVSGRMAQISEVRVFPADLSGVDAGDLGPNGYAVLDLLLGTLDGQRSSLQIHHVLQPPVMFEATAIRSADEVVGVLLVAVDPKLVLNAFQPEHSALGFVRLTQYNGTRPANSLAEVGDPGSRDALPDRLSVAGTLFRLEFRQLGYVGLVSRLNLALMILAGVLCVLASIVLWRVNHNWELQRQAEEAKRKRRRSLGELPALVAAEAAPPDAMAATAEAAPAEPGGDEAAGEAAEAGAAGGAVSAPPPLRLRYNIPEAHRLQEPKHEPVELKPEIFRAYDIRGVISETLDSGVARQVGQAVGTVALERNAAPVVVARDGRLSGPYLMEGMIEGILSTGCDVLDIGAVPTGVLYFAAHEVASGTGVMITGSHNPPDYNGFKIMIAGDTLHGEAIADLYQRIRSGHLAEGRGQLAERNVVPLYIEKIAGDIQVERPLKVVIDCGNGIGGVCAAETLRAIGVEVLPLFDEVDGTFPNHHPDPSEPENLQDLIESVRLMDADLGLALDGDADRLGVVTPAGHIIYPDRVMMLLALDVLDRVPGATIIYDVKCTGHLPKVIREAGGVPMMYKTGHSLIKAKMKEVGSPFAGEMSGHFFFEELWYGVDDGIYSAARLLEILGGTDNPPEAILNALPSSYSTPELKVQMREGENHQFIEQFRASAQFPEAEISTIDGLRADFADGWGLVRASNTTPILVVRFDAETEGALDRIKAEFRSQMLELRPDLELPF
jgi:phosphomannomutase/phosphoglucomutase